VVVVRTYDDVGDRTKGTMTMKRLISAIAVALLLAACTAPSSGSSQAPAPADSAAPAAAPTTGY
jgi:PBP1b-binding outer membrane lipoprotein LpoB